MHLEHWLHQIIFEFSKIYLPHRQENKRDNPRKTLNRNHIANTEIMEKYS